MAILLKKKSAFLGVGLLFNRLISLFYYVKALLLAIWVQEEEYLGQWLDFSTKLIRFPWTILST